MGLCFKCARPTDSVRAGVVNEMGDRRWEMVGRRRRKRRREKAGDFFL